MSEMNDTLVLGIGNLVLQDEGFGIHVIRELERMREEEGADGPLHGVDLLDGGCAGLHLMGYIQNYSRLIVIDASLDSWSEGTVRRLRPSFGEFPPLVTVHEIGLKDLLEALTLTGTCPDTEMIVCSVKKYTSLGTTLSPAVEAAVPRAIALLRETLAE